MDGIIRDCQQVIDEIRKRVVDKTQPCGTPLLLGVGGKTDPFTTTDRDLLERLFCKREKIEGRKPKEGSLEINDAYLTLSNALEMSRATTKGSTKSLRAEDQIEVT